MDGRIKDVIDDGPFRVNIASQRVLEVDGGQSLLAALHKAKIPIPSVCGGRAVCGMCKCRVTTGGGAVLPTEMRLLTKEEIAGGMRLSCQVRVDGDLEIELPAELLNVREYESVCTEIEELTYDIRRFRFELKNPPKIDFTAGQFMKFFCPPCHGRKREISRAYSIASNPAQNNLIDFIIRRVPKGISTTWCFDVLKPGDSVKLSGPYGDFRLSDTDAPMVFVAGGSGLAPFMSMLSEMRNTGSKRPVKYFYGGNTTKDLCLADQMKGFEEVLEDFEFIPVVANPEEDTGWSGQVGLVTDAVRRTYSDLSGHEGYLCGSPGMINAAAKVFIERGMPEEKIYYDKFA